MGMITGFLKQKCQWKQKTGYDENGQVTYSDPVEIRCRWEEKTGFSPVTNAVNENARQGTVRQVQSKVLTEAAVEEQDILIYKGQEWTVASKEVITGLTGREEGRTVYC